MAENTIQERPQDYLRAIADGLEKIVGNPTAQKCLEAADALDAAEAENVRLREALVELVAAVEDDDWSNTDTAIALYQAVHALRDEGEGEG